MACLRGAAGKSGDGAAVAGLKSTWDELFGGGPTSSDLTTVERTPATTTAAASETGTADRADSWLDTAAAVTANHHHHHGDHTAAAADPFDTSAMFDDAFLDKIVGMSRDDDGGTAERTDNDVWNSSSTTQRDAWSSGVAVDTAYSRSPFDDVAAFPGSSSTTATSLWTTAGGDERARPRPRPQAAATAGSNADNPFSVALQAATAAARSALEGLVTPWRAGKQSISVF